MQTEISKDNDKQIVLGSKRENFVVNNSKHLLEQRPRSTGFKSFLNWFKKVENSQRNEGEETSSLSESSGDDSSASSTATVASFAFLPADIYKPYGDACQPEKFIASGPYTETYHRLIGERNRRRNLDKNLSLRKKYSLYSSGTLGGKIDTTLLPHQKVVHAENVNYVQVYDTFSLPAVARKGDYEILFNDNRKTASLSAKDAKAINCHVKGKRKAPQPPANNIDFTKTYRKKRQAPAPPKQIFYSSHITATNIILPQPEDKTPNQSKNKITPLDMEKTKNSFITQSELSPKPWYKRQIIETKPKNKNVKNNSTKKKNKHEYPEVGFFRCSRIFENKKQVPGENSEVEIKQEKRASCLLPNISELDREAAEIIRHHKKDLESRPENSKENLNKPSSARDLINKFNALTNATDVHPANDDGKPKSPLGLLARKQHIDNVLPEKSEKNELFLNNTKSIIDSAKEQIKKYCSICGLENITSGNKCIHCINVQLQSTSVTEVKKEIETKKNPVNFEASQSFQAEVFSAIEIFNFIENKVSSPLPILKITEIKENDLNNPPKLTDAEEKHRLRELLKEMKNSLPKRPKPTKLPVTDLANIANGEVRKESIVFPSPTILQSASNDLPNTKNNKGNLLDLLSKIKPEIIPVIPVQTTSNIIMTKKNTTDSKENVNLKNKPIIVDSKTKKIPDENNAIAPKDSVSTKVSSSAQTNCMVKKFDPFLANKQTKDPSGKETKQGEITNTKKSTDLESKKKDEAVNILSNALYINVQESRNAFPKPKLVDQLNNNNGNTKLLLKKLETAIAQGDDLLAAKLAKDLALLKVNCSVTSTATIHAKEINMKSIQIYIEDQFSHQGPITIRIKEDLTIADLKIRVFEELQIPAGVQRWIIGKQLTTNDNQTLAHFNKNDFNIPLFLYVVAPEVQPEKENKNPPKPIEISKTPAAVKNEITKPVEKTAESSRNSSNVNIDQQKVKKIVTPIVKVEQASQGPSKVKIKSETPALKDVIKKTWICSSCTLINSLLSPLCSACGARKALVSGNKVEEKIEKPLEAKEHYQQLVNLDNADLVLNIEQFECPVCLMECKPGAGVTLRECLHSFCKECLENTVKFCEEAEIKCPYRDKKYFCDSTIQEREIKALVNKTMYEQHLAKSVNFAENKIKNAFHCKSPDCKGWCIFEENVNHFKCPVCKKTNCLTCQAIHEGKNCKEYQEHEQEQASSSSEANGRATKQMLDEMVSRGEAMLCPSCQVVLMKKWGCDWLRCSMCKTEICWVTRGPRWGPAGKGDTSTGCQCGLNGVKCHPKCNYCH